MFTLKNENERGIQLKKVDEQGEYAPFPGVTVVSACYPEQKEFCEAIYKAFVSNPLIVQHFAPLPANSYHMTTMSLETEQQVGSEWNQFITKNLPLYKNIKQTLQKNPMFPSVEKMEVNIDWSISLTLHLPNEQKAQIREIAEALNIEKTIPKVFHMTLAYSRFNKKISEQLQMELTKELNAVIENTKFPFKIAAPKLCYFNNMIAFPLWDAESNPFVQSTPSSHRLFSTIQDDKKGSKDFHEENNHEAALTS